jgi:hypothetical protein
MTKYLGHFISCSSSIFEIFSLASSNLLSLRQISSQIKYFESKFSVSVQITGSNDLMSGHSATGVVWKSAEDIEKLPKTNKAAYRRDMMQVRYLLHFM